MLDPVLKEVLQRIEVRALTMTDAASEIGIGLASLQRHLSGAYVRSDSLAKYRLWLDGAKAARSTHARPLEEASPASSIATDPLAEVSLAGQFASDKRLNVVDLFCGCGGMSLGFERYQSSQVFRTALALDIEAPMVRVFNDNHQSASPDVGIGRQVDITDFTCEAEVKAFYLDHLGRTTGNDSLLDRINRILPYGLDEFRRSIVRLDNAFLSALAEVRKQVDYLLELRTVGSGSLGQTSVVGFHNALKLPPTGSSAPRFGPLLWREEGITTHLDHEGLGHVAVEERLIERFARRAKKQWESEVAKLSERASGAGRGQLASAAARIERFRSFLTSKPMSRVKSLWVNWRAQREAMRATFFEHPSVVCALNNAYDDGNRVSVLLGGPPCQGFSRIGRGKIRSLREQSVHVHEDEDSVDSRNQLMHQYVLFVAALEPDIFLFENVRHFQAVVRSEGTEFDAADVLAEAISNVSSRGLGYSVSRSIVLAAQHAVPQTRERFVMSGVRKDVTEAAGLPDAPAICLTLKRRKPIPLRVALEGLTSPAYSNDAAPGGTCSVTGAESPSEPDSPEDIYKSWTRCVARTDAHIARPPRTDDAEFFALMGPGTRWMDYRCDSAPTLNRLKSVLNKVSSAVQSDPALGQVLGVDAKDLEGVNSLVDGSLSLRLLLEVIAPQPGEVSHHLLTDTYLAKREGAHGDWMSRMDGNAPSKTVVSHMSKDTYAFVHPFEPRTLSVREAARIQAFPDDYKFGSVGLVDGFRVVGNAVPPLLSLQFADRVARILYLAAENYRLKTVTAKTAMLA
jgi:site-specific DNA-cytosine methylase